MNVPVYFLFSLTNKAAIPPVAWAPLLWQVLMTSSMYFFKKWRCIFTYLFRSGRRNSFLSPKNMFVKNKSTIHEELTEFRDYRSGVIPNTAVQTQRVISERIQNFVHLERWHNVFDEHASFDSSVGNSQLLLRPSENFIPQFRFLCSFQLWQIEERTAACCC